MSIEILIDGKPLTRPLLRIVCYGLLCYIVGAVVEHFLHLMM